MQSDYIITPPVYLYKNLDLRIYNKCKIKYKRITLEKRINNIIPDVTIEINNKRLLIEIVYKNEVSLNKYRVIEDLELPTIRIDIKPIVEKLPLFKK